MLHHIHMYVSVSTACKHHMNIICTCISNLLFDLGCGHVELEVSMYMNAGF